MRCGLGCWTEMQEAGQKFGSIGGGGGGAAP